MILKELEPFECETCQGEDRHLPTCPLLFAGLPWLRRLRTHQISAIDEIVDAFQAGVRVVVLDAPTGSGKTLIGEMVRRQLDLRALYVCSNLSLQDQFMGDFPHAALLKGRSNYPVADQDDRDNWDLTCADCTIGERRQCPTCVGNPSRRAESGEPHCDFCHPVAVCPYRAARNRALAAKLVCTNTSYFLTEANYVGGFTNIPLVIVDECDTLEATLLNFATVEITERQRADWGIVRPEAQSGPKLVEWVERNYRRLNARLEAMIASDEPDEDGLPMPVNVRARRDRSRLESLVRKMSGLHEGIESGQWICTSMEPKIVFKPTHVKALGQDWLWEHGQRWLFMSASVLDATELLGSVGYDRETVGRAATVEVASIFPVENRPIVIKPVAKMVYAQMESAKPKMAVAIRNLMDQHPNDRILVHTWTYALTKFFTEQVDSPRVISYYSAAERENVLNLFKSRANAVLFAASLQRGIDLKDDLCRVILIPKVPYIGLDDLQVKARMREPDGQKWYVVQTARTILQMTGRGVRHEADHCTTYILDAQFATFWAQAERVFPDYWREAVQWQ